MNEYGFLISSYDGLYEVATMSATTKYEGAISVSPIGGLNGTINVSNTYPNVRAETHTVTVVALDGDSKALPNAWLYNESPTVCRIKVTANCAAGPTTANTCRFILLRLI